MVPRFFNVQNRPIEWAWTFRITIEEINKPTEINIKEISSKIYIYINTQGIDLQRN